MNLMQLKKNLKASENNMKNKTELSIKSKNKKINVTQILSNQNFKCFSLILAQKKNSRILFQLNFFRWNFFLIITNIAFKFTLNTFVLQYY